MIYNLKFLVFSELGIVYGSQLRTQDAKNVLEAQLALANEAGKQEKNLGVIHFQLGINSFTLFDFELAITEFLKAMNSARQANNNF